MSIYNELFPFITSNMEEKQSRESPRGRHKPGRRALGGRARPPGLSPPRALFRLFIIFLIFLYIPKRTESTFMEVLESVYLPYHIPTPFQDSGAFRKVSSMCSSGVIV